MECAQFWLALAMSVAMAFANRQFKGICRVSSAGHDTMVQSRAPGCTKAAVFCCQAWSSRFDIAMLWLLQTA
ncbi:hypothetical protein V8C86DRAFT_2554762 [Haematococcus lacustris]